MYLVIQLTWETGRLSLQKPGPEKTECILKDKFWNSNLQDPGVPGIDNNFIWLDLASPGYTSLGVNILRASVANSGCGVFIHLFPNFGYFVIHSLLAPTGALIVLMFYYSIGSAGHFLKFRAFLPLYLVFLFENWLHFDNNWPFKDPLDCCCCCC